MTSLPVAPGTAYQQGSVTQDPSTNGLLYQMVVIDIKFSTIDIITTHSSMVPIKFSNRKSSTRVLFAEPGLGGGPSLTLIEHSGIIGMFYNLIPLDPNSCTSKLTII
jgi:hypothetical protein